MLDILSGCYSESGHDVMVGVLWLLRGQEGGGFAKPVGLRGTDGELLMVHHAFEDRNAQLVENICTKPYACDVDGDGDLDLVVGNFKGTFFVFEGEGKGAFKPQPAPLATAAGETLQTSGAHSDPFLVDWDGDGDLDLLASSSDGSIQWAENKAAAADGEAPAPLSLTGFRTLIAPRKGAPGPGGCTRIHVADFNDDGALDVLVGDQVTVDGERTGEVWLYLRKQG